MKDFMLAHYDNNQAEVIEAFNYTQRILHECSCLMNLSNEFRKVIKCEAC